MVSPKDQARATYDEAARSGSITMPSGKILKFGNVTREQFERLVARHDQRFGRVGDARANTFRR
jgi:hypothetical protein